MSILVHQEQKLEVLLEERKKLEEEESLVQTLGNNI
jgi:hypothetical protein